MVLGLRAEFLGHANVIRNSQFEKICTLFVTMPCLLRSLVPKYDPNYARRPSLQYNNCTLQNLYCLIPPRHRSHLHHQNNPKLQLQTCRPTVDWTCSISLSKIQIYFSLSLVQQYCLSSQKNLIILVIHRQHLHDGLDTTSPHKCRTHVLGDAESRTRSVLRKIYETVTLFDTSRMQCQ